MNNSGVLIGTIPSATLLPSTRHRDLQLGIGDLRNQHLISAEERLSLAMAQQK